MALMAVTNQDRLEAAFERLRFAVECTDDPKAVAEEIIVTALATNFTTIKA